jgi:dihydroxyacetone kinase-like protein
VSGPIDYAVLSRMLLAAAARIRDGRDRLSELDAATGDGDHGTAMTKVAEAVTQTVEAYGGTDASALLSDIGWAVMGTDAGSTSPLYGSFFLGLGEGVGAGSMPLDGAALAAVIESGVAQLRSNTRAQPGDKTMLDALLPAAEAIRRGAGAGDDPGACLAAGAAAAAQGAEATAGMRAARGRAKNIGERSVGHVDPGAASMALLFAGLEEGYTNA